MFKRQSRMVCFDGYCNSLGSFKIVVCDCPTHGLFLHFSCNIFFSFKDSIGSMTYLTFSVVSFLNKALLFGSFIPQKKENPKHFLFYDRSKWFMSHERTKFD